MVRVGTVAGICFFIPGFNRYIQKDIVFKDIAFDIGPCGERIRRVGRVPGTAVIPVPGAYRVGFEKGGTFTGIKGGFAFGQTYPIAAIREAGRPIGAIRAIFRKRIKIRVWHEEIPPK